MQRAKAWKWAALSTLCLISSAPAGASSAPAPAAPAAAKPASGGLGANSNAPVDITSDQSDIYTVDGVKHQVYKGNVDVVQGDARLRTPQLTVYFAKQAVAPTPAKAPAPGAAGASFGKIERMEAEGPVYYTTPTQNAKGDHGTYIAADDTITMTGNVVLLQDKNVGTGDKLVIEQKTGHSTLYSGNKGRVRGVFYQDAAQPAAGAAPKAAPKPAAHP
jgi:lipopolysaccharide export system protein LptA